MCCKLFSFSAGSEVVYHVILQRSVFMVHQKKLKSPRDGARWTRGQTSGGGGGSRPPASAPQRRLPALPPPPSTAWPWWTHMDPSYPEALLAFLEMRLRRKYLQDRRHQPSLISDGTQTDDASRLPADAERSRPSEILEHRTSGLPESGTLGHSYGRQITGVSDELRNAQHSSSSSRDDETIVSNWRTATCSHSSQKTHSTPNQQVLEQESGSISTIGSNRQGIRKAPCVTPRMEAVQSSSVTPSSQLSSNRTFSMRGGEWYVEHQSSSSEVKPGREANSNYPSIDGKTDRMFITKALNPKPQRIFHKLFRFQTKSTVNSDTSQECSIPSDRESTEKKDLKVGSSTCKIPGENICKKDFLKVNKDVAVYSFKDTDKRALAYDFDMGKRHARRTDYSHHRTHGRSKPADELRCIYFNESPSYSSLVDDLFYESDSSSSEVNLFFTTMNFGTTFSDTDCSSGSASSTYSPRKSKDREECIDLRNALTSESEDQYTEETEDEPTKQSARVPVSTTRCHHSSVRPVPFSNEQHKSVSTVKMTTAATVANYCGIHDTTSERFEIEFLKNAVIKLFDMNPEQLKGDFKSVPVQMESTITPTASTSRKSPARSPRTPRRTDRKTTRLRTKETDQGIFARVWRNIVRLFQRKTECTQDSGRRTGNERTVRQSCAALPQGKSGSKAYEVNDRDPNIDGTFTLRAPTLSPIDEVPEPTTSGSSAFGTGHSNSELSASTRRKTSTKTTFDTVK